MNLSLYIARRYFLSAKKRSFINVISIISMLTVAVGTMSLVVVLSVFNGMEDLIRSLYVTFDPEIKISASNGKSFKITDQLIAKINSVGNIDAITEVIEDNALLRYQDNQIVVKIKGMSANYKKQNNIDSMVVEGNFLLQRGKMEYAVIGRGIQNMLGVNIRNKIYPLQMWYPKVSRNASINPENAFNRDIILPEGVFAIEKQYDDHFVFVPIGFCERLMNYKGKRTSFEIKTKDKTKLKSTINNLREILGTSFLVQNSDEQHAALVKAVNIEKMFVIFTFALILAVASINIYFSLSMLVIEKQKDISILKSLGTTDKAIKRIFIGEGAMIAFTGAFIGLSLGFLICFLQQTYGIVPMGMESSIIDSYPVKMRFDDFITTAGIIILVTILVSYPPANKASKLVIKEHIN